MLIGAADATRRSIENRPNERRLARPIDGSIDLSACRLSQGVIRESGPFSPFMARLPFMSIRSFVRSEAGI